MINGVKYDDMPERYRKQAPLTRLGTTIDMEGINKKEKYHLMLNGEYICIEVKFDSMSKNAKLQVGQQMVTAKPKNGSYDRSSEPFPMSINLKGLLPM